MASKGRKRERNFLKISYSADEKTETACIPHETCRILRHYQNQMRNADQKIDPRCETRKMNTSKPEKLSAESIMKMARMRLLQLSSQNKPRSLSFNFHSELSEENLDDVELAYNLLLAAEKLAIQQFENAEKFLNHCLVSASGADKPIRRVITYFAEALSERIDKQMGRIDIERKIFNEEEYMKNSRSAILAGGLKLPFCQVSIFVGMQAILDSTESATKIHFIDFGIRSGSHCIVLMQGLANRKGIKLDLLKITAVGTSKCMFDGIGQRLTSFAESLDLPFSFQEIVSETKDLRKELFELEADEVVVVHSGLVLRCLLAQPNKLTSFVKFVKKLKPCVMLVSEIEANMDTEIFMQRFREAVSFASALFDCLEACLQDDFLYRKVFEEVCFRFMLRGSIAIENDERTLRYAKIGFWREFFGEFGIVEGELSQSCLYQARLVLETSQCWNACTIDMDGKSMILRWNGTPIKSLSVWKFLA